MNRAKPIIYSTAPSVFDTALALVNFEHIQENVNKYRKKIEKRQKMATKKFLGIKRVKVLFALWTCQSNELVHSLCKRA